MNQDVLLPRAAAGPPLAARISSRSGLILLLTVYVLLGLVYDFTVPFFEKPDELKHFAMIQYIRTQGRLPVVQAGVLTLWDQEGTQPPLYHLLAAAAVSWLDLSGFVELPRNPHYADDRSFTWRERGNNNLYLHAPDEARSLAPVFLAARLARWISLLAGLVTILLTYSLARLFFLSAETNRPASLSARLPLVAASLVAFLPQFLHVSSAISNDGLSVALAAAALFVLALILRYGSSTCSVFFLGVFLGLGALTKLSLLYLAPLGGLVLLLDFARHRSLRRLLANGAKIALPVLLLAGWWYWRNWQLYGDVTALNAHLLYRGGPLDPRPTLAQLWQTELTGLELSFWAAFGAGHILLEPWLYAALGWVKYAVLLGVLVGIWRGLSRPLSLARAAFSSGRPFPRSLTGFSGSVSAQALILALLALWIFIIFVALLRWMQITPASWGRLLFPTLPALAVLATWGLSQFHRSLVLPFLLALSLFLLALIGPVRYIQAAYAKTPLVPESAISADEMEPVNLVYDDTLRLLGYRVERSSVQPGEWLPVTLYWQVLRPTSKNYSTFAHLLGRDQAVAGQVNTYPDGGNWPTSLLEPGQVLRDTYHVPVSPEAAAPAVIRLAVGIFEFEDPTRTAKIAVDPAGQVVQPLLGSVPLLPNRWPAPEPAHPLAVNFAGQVRLIGYDGPVSATIKPGTRVPITFYWETLAAPGQNLTLFIHLQSTSTQAQAAGFDGPPDFPTLYWQPGYTVTDSRWLVLPADLPPGDYRLVVGWYNSDTLVRLSLADASAGDAWPLLELRVQP